jgi:hypothetical protein
VNLRIQWESGRPRCLKIDLFSGDGVAKSQMLGVQEIALIRVKYFSVRGQLFLPF